MIFWNASCFTQSAILFIHFDKGTNDFMLLVFHWYFDVYKFFIGYLLLIVLY